MNAQALERSFTRNEYLSGRDSLTVLISSHCTPNSQISEAPGYPGARLDTNLEGRLVNVRIWGRILGRGSLILMCNESGAVIILNDPPPCIFSFNVHMALV